MDNEELYKQLKRLEQENKQMKSALEEIRNLVKGHKVADEVRLKSILDKINEVLGDN